jgi:threonine dehydratase
MSANEAPSSLEIGQAHERILPFIHRTPLLTNQTIDNFHNGNLFFKCENFQKVGAFKARGGINAVLSLSEQELTNGIATHSSGNHAQAIAYAAKQAGTKAYIVMPENAPKIKIAAVKSYGAEITFCPNTPEDRQQTVDEIVTRTGATFIHPYNNYAVIAGQATAAKEMIEDCPVTLDVIIAPVGGGGLLSGTALSTGYFSPTTKVIAGEPAGAADAVLSFQTGKIEKAPFIDTIADGLLTPLGDKTLPIIRAQVSKIVTVTDDEIRYAMQLIWERMKLVIEPSAAVGLATALKLKEELAGKAIGIILTGGNLDLSRLPF